MEKAGNKCGFWVKILVLFLAISLFFVVDKSATYIADLFLKGSFGYSWLFLHHTLQALIIMLIILLPFWSKSLSDWGINTKNWKLTLRILTKFTIGWIVFTTIYNLITSWLSGWPHLLNFYLTPKNIIIYLLFEATIVGISEELLFRGLIYGVLHKHFNKQVKLIGFSISQAGIISALLFGFAHIGIQYFPFSITYFNTMQLVIAVGLGLFYAALLEKTDSLIGPILAHNISDLWLSILFLGIEFFSKGF